MICPICGAERPVDMHADWCTYDGPEPDDDDHDDDRLAPDARRAGTHSRDAYTQ